MAVILIEPSIRFAASLLSSIRGPLFPILEQIRRGAGVVEVQCGLQGPR